VIAVTSWHYEYMVGQMLHHFDAGTYQECLDVLLEARTRHPQLTGVKIFESGKRVHDAALHMFDSSERDRIAA
jgi:hypothetical protein